MGCLSAGAFRILRLHRLLGIELLQVFQVQAKGQGIPVEIGMGVVGKSAHAGDVRALVIGSDAEQRIVVLHRLLQVSLEEFQGRELIIIHAVVAGDDAESTAACRNEEHLGVRIRLRLADALFHELCVHVVVIQGDVAKHLLDVSHLLAVTIHQSSHSDARHLDFHLLCKLLADGEALTVLQGTCLGERILGDESL